MKYVPVINCGYFAGNNPMYWSYCNRPHFDSEEQCEEWIKVNIDNFTSNESSGGIYPEKVDDAIEEKQSIDDIIDKLDNNIVNIDTMRESVKNILFYKGSIYDRIYKNLKYDNIYKELYRFVKDKLEDIEEKCSIIDHYLLDTKNRMKTLIDDVENLD